MLDRVSGSGIVVKIRGGEFPWEFMPQNQLGEMGTGDFDGRLLQITLELQFRLLDSPLDQFIEGFGYWESPRSSFMNNHADLFPKKEVSQFRCYRGPRAEGD